jgi:hypothetical protein
MSSKDSKTKTPTKKTVAEKVVDVPTANTIVENKMEDKVVTVEKKGGKKTSVESTTVKNTESVPVKASKSKVVKALEQENTVVETKEEVKADKKGKTKTVKEVVIEETPVKETKKVDVKTEPVDKKKTEKKPVKVEDQVGGATVAAVDAAVDAAAEEEVVGNKLRYFKLIYNDVVQGRYCGKKPKQAANKAFSSIIKSLKQTGGQQGGVNVDINFTIRECTRNSKHKDYMYVGKRQVLDNPVKVQIANADGSVKQIEYKYHNKLQKAPKA